MKRFSRTAWLLTAVAAVVLLAVVAAPALAGSGVNHKVKITNGTTMMCWATLYTGALGDSEGTKQIPPGQTVTFETGAKCPIYMVGVIEPTGPNQRHSLRPICINGVPYPTCGVACWSSEFRICRKDGEPEDAEIHGEDFGFCKD